MLYGLLIVPRGTTEEAIRDDFSRLREKHHWGMGEFKWEKVSTGKLHIYQEFVDVFFAHPSAEFRCLVVDKSQIDYVVYHQGDREAAFYEFYYQAISRNLSADNKYWVYADSRNNRQANRWEELKAKANEHWIGQGAQRNLVRVVEPRSSKEDDLLQITDVLLGAVGYDVEQRAESPAKVEMVHHIAEQIGCKRLREHWGRNSRFNIWNFRFPDAGGK